MPLAPSSKTNQIQAAALKPWLNPYQGTTVTAVAKVAANMLVVIQFREIDSAFTLLATGVMGTHLSPGDQPSCFLNWQTRLSDGNIAFGSRRLQCGNNILYHTRFTPAVGNPRV